jgi:hypothetical protein
MHEEMLKVTGKNIPNFVKNVPYLEPWSVIKLEVYSSELLKLAN